MFSTAEVGINPVEVRKFGLSHAYSGRTLIEAVYRNKSIDRGSVDS